MIQVLAYSRLHFGLLNPAASKTAGCEMVGTRFYGGVGLMLESPSLRLSVEPAAMWSAEGPLAERALSFAQRFTAETCRDEQKDCLPPHCVRIERVMPVHVGLGSGTQLALAVAKALAASWNVPCDLATLARRCGRGLRSALGTHGFEQGGFLVESGKNSAEQLAPLVARLPFPDDWRLVVALPAKAEGVAGLHGRGEREAFALLAANPVGRERMEGLCRLVLLGLLPTLAERDLDAFGDALHEFNARVGEAFAPVQGGLYASPIVAEMVTFVRGQNVRGVGQSSWGPAVFAVVADAKRGEHLAARLSECFDLPPSAVWVTPASNHGATVEEAKLATDKHR